MRLSALAVVLTGFLLAHILNLLLNVPGTEIIFMLLTIPIAKRITIRERIIVYTIEGYAAIAKQSAHFNALILFEETAFRFPPFISIPLLIGLVPLMAILFAFMIDFLFFFFPKPLKLIGRIENN